MNKYVLITGASSGIGKEASLRFAELGYNLIIVARRSEELEKLKSEILQINDKLDVVVKVADLSVPQSAHELFNSLDAYELHTLINNAGFGNFDFVSDQDLNKISNMIHLNIESLTVLSTLFVNKYENVEGTQLINVSSVGGYGILATAVTYCATKFYVSAFTEGIAGELKLKGSKMQAKVLAPAATETEFANNARDLSEDFDYNNLPKFHTSKEVSEFLIQLYQGDKVVGLVNPETYEFNLLDPMYRFISNN